MPNSIVGPWAKDKLKHLGKYLHAYTQILHRQKWCQGFYYIDAFAGPGGHVVRKRSSHSQQALLDVADFSAQQEEQREYVAGSPRVALELQHPFTDYIFVERSSERIAALRALKEEYGESRRIHIREEDCTRYLRDKIVRNPKLDWSTHRALVFLDPFGMQVGWDTIRMLAQTKAIEIFLNFPVGMAIQRLLLRNPEKFTEAQRRRLDDYFGAPDWVDVLYPKRKTLFEDVEQEKIEASGAALMRWYRLRLRTLFPHVSRAALIRNTRGGHLYYLLLASHNPTGVKIADAVLSAGETV